MGDSAAPPAPVAVGDVVPDISLLDHRGEPFVLSEHRGRPIVLVLHRHLA